MKKKKTILAAAAVVLVLAAAFWYGGDAPGLQGWSLSQGSDQSGQALPQTPAGTDQSAPAGEAEVQGSAAPGDGEEPDEIPEPGETEEPATGPAQPAEEGGDASAQPAEPAQPPAQSTPPQPALPPEPSGEAESTACRISIVCATVLDHLDWLAEGKEEILPAGGIVLAETEAEPEEGETAFSLLQRVVRAEGIHLEASFTPGTGAAYVEGIANLYEFDCGQRSGWLYLVNGVSPGYSSSEYVLEPGDRVEWVYTCDMGRDVGAAAGG